MLLLDGGARGHPRVEADLERLAGRPIEVIDWTRQLAQVATATKVESTALLAFALVATLVTFVLGGDRHRPDGGGVRRRGRDAARPSGSPVARRRTAAAARPAAGGRRRRRRGGRSIAWLLSGRYPIGVGREGEPSPGRHANVADPGRRRRGPRARRRRRRAPRGVADRPAPGHRRRRRSRSRSGAVGASDLPLPMTMGGRLALERRPGVGGRAATVALTFGVTAVVAALTFGAGLDRGSHGRRAERPAVRHLHGPRRRRRPADRRRRRMAGRRAGRLGDPHRRHRDADQRPAGRRVRRHRPEGPLRRPPAARPHAGRRRRDLLRPDRDAPPRARRRRHASSSAGARCTSSARCSRRRPGTPATTRGAGSSPATLDALVRGRRPGEVRLARVRAAPGVADAEQYDELWQGVEGDIGGRVDAQRNLWPTRLLPRLLAGFVVMLTIGATGYAIASTARRRRREVAVLQVLGLTRRQARATVGWHVGDRGARRRRHRRAAGLRHRPHAVAGAGRRRPDALRPTRRHARLVAVGGGVRDRRRPARRAARPHDGAGRAGDAAEGRVSRPAARHGGLVAGAALVVATTWITAAGRAAGPLAVVGRDRRRRRRGHGAVVVGRPPRRPPLAARRGTPRAAIATACSSPR